MSIVECASFAELVAGREAEFPTLARAAANTVPALNPKVEWLVEGDDGLETNWNYTQIFRFPFGISGLTQREREYVVAPPKWMRDGYLNELLRAVEQTLIWGVRSLVYTNTRFCGGVLDLLGRDFLADDVLTLRPYEGREPCLRVVDKFLMGTQTPNPNPTWEWIAETSLQVLPAVREETYA